MQPSGLVKIIQSLKQRQAAGSEIFWEDSGEGVFKLHLPSFTLEIGSPDAQTAGYPEIELKAISPTNTLIATQILNAEDSAYNDAKFLLDSAINRRPQSEKLLLDFAAFLANDAGPIGVPLSPPPVPSGPSQEQSAKFFRRIEGNWNLDYERGKESLAIDSFGNYFYLTPQKGKPVAQTIKPVFRLVLISCDESLSKVELAKEEPSGRVRQIEVLTVTENEMIGTAKHDGHKLRYVRI